MPCTDMFDSFLSYDHIVRNPLCTNTVINVIDLTDYLHIIDLVLVLYTHDYISIVIFCNIIFAHGTVLTVSLFV